MMSPEQFFQFADKHLNKGTVLVFKEGEAFTSKDMAFEWEAPEPIPVSRPHDWVEKELKRQVKKINDLLEMAYKNRNKTEYYRI